MTRRWMLGGLPVDTTNELSSLADALADSVQATGRLLDRARTEALSASDITRWERIYGELLGGSSALVREVYLLDSEQQVVAWRAEHSALAGQASALARELTRALAAEPEARLASIVIWGGLAVVGVGGAVFALSRYAKGGRH